MTKRDWRSEKRCIRMDVDLLGSVSFLLVLLKMQLRDIAFGFYKVVGDFFQMVFKQQFLLELDPCCSSERFIGLRSTFCSRSLSFLASDSLTLN